MILLCQNMKESFGRVLRVSIILSSFIGVQSVCCPSSSSLSSSSSTCGAADDAIVAGCHDSLTPFELEIFPLGSECDGGARVFAISDLIVMANIAITENRAFSAACFSHICVGGAGHDDCGIGSAAASSSVDRDASPPHRGRYLCTQACDWARWHAILILFHHFSTCFHFLN